MRFFVVIFFGVIPIFLAGCQTPEDTRPELESAPLGEPAVEHTVTLEAGFAGSLSPDLDDFYDRAEPAAHAAIEAYLALTDEITSAAGLGASRMRDLVSENWWPIEAEALGAWAERRERTLGHTRFEDYRLQLARITPEGTMDVAMFGCVDSSEGLILGVDEADPPPEVIEWLGAGEEYLGTDEQWGVIEEYLLQSPLRSGGRTSVVFWLTGPTLEQLRVDVSEDWWGEHGC